MKEKNTLIYLLASILVFVSTLLKADQEKHISSLFAIDKVINTEVEIKGNYDEQNYTTYKDGQYLWMFLPDKAKEDSLTFLKFNLTNGTREKLSFRFPSSMFYVNNPSRLKSFEVDKNGHIHFLFNDAFGKFLPDDDSSFIMPVASTYTDIVATNDDAVLLIRYYPYSSLSVTEPVEISVFSYEKQEVVNYIRPQNDCIEFSHFSPSDLIDVQGNTIVFTQSCNYKVQLFDIELNEKEHLSTDKANWVKMDMDHLQRMRMYDYDGSDWIRELDSFNNHISRIDGVFLLNEENLLVRYVAGGNSDPGQLRKFDYWSKNEKGEWHIIYEGLMDEATLNLLTMVERLDNRNMNIILKAQSNWPPSQNMIPVSAMGLTVTDFGNSYTTSVINAPPNTFSEEGKWNGNEDWYKDYDSLSLHIFVFSILID